MAQYRLDSFTTTNVITVTNDDNVVIFTINKATATTHWDSTYFYVDWDNLNFSAPFADLIIDGEYPTSGANAASLFGGLLTFQIQSSEGRPYKLLALIVSQVAPDPPFVVRELRNEIGEYSFTGDEGEYAILCEGCFPVNQTSQYSYANGAYSVTIQRSDDDELEMISALTFNGAPADDLLSNTYIEIKVFN